MPRNIVLKVIITPQKAQIVKRNFEKWLTENLPQGYKQESSDDPHERGFDTEILQEESNQKFLLISDRKENSGQRCLSFECELNDSKALEFLEKTTEYFKQLPHVIVTKSLSELKPANQVSVSNLPALIPLVYTKSVATTTPNTPNPSRPQTPQSPHSAQSTRPTTPETSAYGASLQELVALRQTLLRIQQFCILESKTQPQNVNALKDQLWLSANEMKEWPAILQGIIKSENHNHEKGSLVVDKLLAKTSNILQCFNNDKKLMGPVAKEDPIQEQLAVLRHLKSRLTEKLKQDPQTTPDNSPRPNKR